MTCADIAVAAVLFFCFLSELNVIFAIKEEHITPPKARLCKKDIFCFTLTS